MTASARILVVDDTPVNVTLLEDMLAAYGYEVITAGDGVEALEKMSSLAPDLVLLDIMMPRMDGYQVLERLRADQKMRHIPVIMISAVDEIESVVRCVALGAEDYLPKPFNSTLLRARVSASLEKKVLRDQVRASLRRLEQELAAARELQLSMLPDTGCAWSGCRSVQIAAVMDPAREVGGDLYDFFDAGQGLFCFLVGDVSGKGAAAAMFMARAQSLVRMAARFSHRGDDIHVSPADIAEAVNSELYQNNRDRMFVTMFLGFLDTATGALTYVNAGHLQPHVLRDYRIWQIPGKPEVPLAVRAGSTYQNRTVRLEAGDALFVFTDGVIEATNADGALYGYERLEAAVKESAACSPDEVIRIVKEQIDGFVGEAPRADDLTMMALRWRPAAVTADLVIFNDIQQLAILTQTMERIGAEHGIPARALTHLQVVLDEMVSNVIKYGWNDQGKHEIHVRISVVAEEVRIEIIDDGLEFNPLLALPPSRADRSPRPPGGLGIHMVRQLVNEVDYKRFNGRNHVTLIKRCTADASNR